MIALYKNPTTLAAGDCFNIFLKVSAEGALDFKDIDNHCAES